MNHLNPEQERALRVIARLSGIPANREEIDRLVSFDCMTSLVRGEYIAYDDSYPEMHPYGASDRVVLLLNGRNYFAEKRRDRWRRWAPVVVGSLLGALIGGAFTIAGVLLGASLS